MNPIRQQAPRRAEWESEVTRYIEEDGDGMSASDAQAIMEAQPVNVDMLWKGYRMPREAAAAILEFSEAQAIPNDAAQLDVKAEAIATADAHLSNVGLPTYTAMRAALECIGAQSTGADWTPAQAIAFIKSHARATLRR